MSRRLAESPLCLWLNRSSHPLQTWPSEIPPPDLVLHDTCGRHRSHWKCLSADGSVALRPHTLWVATTAVWVIAVWCICLRSNIACRRHCSSFCCIQRELVPNKNCSRACPTAIAITGGIDVKSWVPSGITDATCCCWTTAAFALYFLWWYTFNPNAKLNKNASVYPMAPTKEFASMCACPLRQ